MKVLKSNWFRLILYIIGYVSIIFSILGLAGLFVRLSTFENNEDFNTVYEESYSVKRDIKIEATNLQEDAKLDNQTKDIELSDALLEMYDYSDLISTEADKKSDKKNEEKSETVNAGDLLDEADEIQELKSYVDPNGGSETIYGAYSATTDEPEDNRFIRMTWGEYQGLVRNTCERFNYSSIYDEKGEIANEALLSYTDEIGLSEGDYCAYIDNKLYVYQPDNELIYFDSLGYMSIPVSIEKKDYIYFPYDPEIAQDKLDEYILSSKMYRNNVELYYAFLSDESKSKLQGEPSNYEYYSIGGNTAYSLDGKNVDNCFIFCSDGLESVKRLTSNSYNYSFAELSDLIKKSSDIFVKYDAKSGKLEQWYKDKSGNQVPYEYISEKDLTRLTDTCNEDFVIGINNTSANSSNMGNKMVYEFCRTFDYPIWSAVMAVIVFLACVVLLIVAEPAKMHPVDKAPYVVWWGIYSMLITCGAGITGSVIVVPRLLAIMDYNIKNAIIVMVLGLLIIYLMSAAVVMNIVRRTKCAKFLEGFLIFRLIKFLYKKIKAVANRMPGKKVLIALSIVVVLANMIGMLLLCINTYEVIWCIFKILIIFVVMAVDIFACIYILKYMADIQTVLKTSKQLEAGELDAKVDTSKMHADAAQLGDSLNNLGTGLSTAVESSIRDERTKAELITNVSHDIKTPLTSIINYVDLLKKEDIKNDKANEYIDVLDQKSQRLKQLILDLIEASKTSTGNIELENINLNLAELIYQGLGEYEDRFQQAELELIKNISNENVVIYADGRRVFRIIDNLLNNAVKYAKAGTRVYVDLAENDGRVVFSIKNLSNDMLNISADELMERFVRGDRSRNTEGSGLGLSIAKNLTELQGGTFDINIDGDLFKVEVAFPVVK